VTPGATPSTATHARHDFQSPPQWPIANKSKPLRLLRRAGRSHTPSCDSVHAPQGTCAVARGLTHWRPHPSVENRHAGRAAHAAAPRHLPTLPDPFDRADQPVRASSAGAAHAATARLVTRAAAAPHRSATVLRRLPGGAHPKRKCPASQHLMDGSHHRHRVRCAGRWQDHGFNLSVLNRRAGECINTPGAHMAHRGVARSETVHAVPR
jgi:hypothetical protein